MLMYSNDDQLLTRDQINLVPTPPPHGRFHQPVPFGEYIDLAAHTLDRQGIDIVREEYCVTKDRQSFFGCMEIQVEQFDRPDMRLIVGLRGSHNQRLPRGMCLGNQVIVCSNLCFGGDLAKFHTKQTTNIWDRLPELMRQAVGNIPQVAYKEHKRVDAYRGFTFNNPRHGDAALVQLHRDGALAGNQLTRAIHQWDTPAHEEHAEDGFTAWRLLNAVTEAQKTTENMNIVQERTRKTTAFLDHLVDLPVAA